MALNKTKKKIEGPQFFIPGVQMALEILYLFRRTPVPDVSIIIISVPFKDFVLEPIWLF